MSYIACMKPQAYKLIMIIEYMKKLVTMRLVIISGVSYDTTVLIIKVLAL